jgi:hypothetical protein
MSPSRPFAVRARHGANPRDDSTTTGCCWDGPATIRLGPSAPPTVGPSRHAHRWADQTTRTLTWDHTGPRAYRARCGLNRRDDPMSDEPPMDGCCSRDPTAVVGPLKGARPYRRSRRARHHYQCSRDAPHPMLSA